MSFVMSPEERAAFLSEVHVGVLAVERAGRAPLAVPIWYGYRHDEIRIWMERDSVKDRAIRAAGRFSFTVQTETPPYRYVTAEGPVVAADGPPSREEAESIAGRYLPASQVASYVDTALHDRTVLVRMRPARWLSNDHGKG
ncbi:PPOX class probable F420-dependent enzyme [Pseudonocardia ammonioxydans]|uniref:PPOX class probable F420-dependent enzyme n=1 Tax=Pseudonocardia ammonioxydans TaxID=260086 RepID=A0A1I5DXZ3_PSUAM|nr:pyridoxamine 5'-phosphate oxidase family protein [Pseudonocardia ammonioxydans]SFO04135.1 PPOX class probable F420-dependent enzyme [Pseudonocardia ammonioxydans]